MLFKRKIKLKDFIPIFREAFDIIDYSEILAETRKKDIEKKMWHRFFWGDDDISRKS